MCICTVRWCKFFVEDSHRYTRVMLESAPFCTNCYKLVLNHICTMEFIGGLPVFSHNQNKTARCMAPEDHGAFVLCLFLHGCGKNPKSGTGRPQFEPHCFRCQYRAYTVTYSLESFFYSLGK